MRCCVPFCRSSADNAAWVDEVTFHHFPSDAELCEKWLRAIGKHNQPLKDSAVVCSQHFLDDDFCKVEGGSRQVRFGVVPSTVKLCIICLDTDRNVVSLSKYNLEDAYEKLTGHSIYREGYLKQTLCIECAQRLINFDKFRSKSLKARSAMMDLVKMHETVTIRHIKQINYIRELLKSEIVKTTFAPDHCDLHIKDCNNEDVQTEPRNVVPDAVKIEPYECTLDESHIRLKLEATNEDNGDVNIESQDPTDYINNIPDAGILLETKLMHEALNTELDLDEAIKSECSVCSDDDYNGHNDDARHAESGSEECDTKLAHRIHTALHSQHCETNQAWDGNSSTDYPHSSVKLLPTPQYELASKKKNTLKTIKNCIIASEPEGGETTNSLTLNLLKEHKFDCEKIITGDLQVYPVPVFETFNKHNYCVQEYYCEHCEYKCSERDYILKHLENHTTEERLSCSYNRECKSKSSLASHITRNSGVKPFSCKLCEYAGRTKELLVSHMRIHTGEKPFSCKLCEYASSRQESLVRHMRIHTGEKPFSCKLCEYACRSKENLTRHMRIHTGEKPFSCKLCKYTCSRQESLVRHMRIHTGEKPFSCKSCEYTCKTKEHLVSHTRIHTGEKPFSCKLCEYVCRTKDCLVRHMKIHTGEKPFSCKLCEYACRSKENLTRHMRIHTGEKPFSCTLCKYTCSRQESLVRHMRIHTGEKPFSCKSCEYTCKTKEHLVSHTRIHTGEKPFSCKLCKYAGRTKDCLVRHMRIHTGEKSFSCKLCDYACRTKGSLIKHMIIHTGDKTFLV